MGMYLNPGGGMFKESRKSKIYIDKSEIIAFLNESFDTRQKYVFVSRPRRFGKSMTLEMISAYYDRTVDGKTAFNGLKILEDRYSVDNAENMNKYNVIFINMQNFLSEASNVEEMLDNLQQSILHDLIEEYPDCNYRDKNSLTKVLATIYMDTKIKFVILIDEWDCIFREYKERKTDQNKYLDFLRNWLKDREYVGLAYMTGILPIKKYGTHSALNMFKEYSMTNPGQLAKFIGFTEDEVRNLCTEYEMDFEEMKAWYDGYYFLNAGSIYNPNSVVESLSRKMFDDYWNQTETFEALRIYIDMNFSELKDKVLSLMAGERVEVEISRFNNDMATFGNYEDILVLLVHLGYLAFDHESKEVFIPNKELGIEFKVATAVSEWQEVIKSVEKSKKLLQSTWQLDEEAVSKGLQEAHLETAHIKYNSESALSYTLSLAYYTARDYYNVIRELPSGNGFADIAFIPRRKHADKPAIVVELKWDKTANAALDQIKNKKYFKELEEYNGKVLLVAVNYDKKTRKHECIIEEIIK